MSEVRWINNLKGVLYYSDVPVFDFEVKERKLIKAELLSNGKYMPPELAVFGVNYVNLNEFFCRRSMKENCMFYREYLHNIGMEKFDFDQYIRINKGENHLDNYWVKF